MERAEVLSRERLIHDPIYERAKELAKDILKEIQPAKEARIAINEYRSDAHRLRFLDALRAELLLRIEEHRDNCKEARCGREVSYAEVVYVIQDELELLNPTIAARDSRFSITEVEATELLRIKNELLDAIHDGQVRILEAQSITLQAVVEEIEDLWAKMPYGKKDWSALVTTYLRKKAVEKGLDSAVLAPFAAEIERALNQ